MTIPLWGERHSLLIGRLRTFSSAARSRKSKCKKMRNGASTLDVLYSIYNIQMAWANSSCLSLHEAMREPSSRISEK
jgi:hypothetical protein